MTDPSLNAKLNAVKLENGRIVSWAEAFPRNFKLQLGPPLYGITHGGK